MCDDYLLRFGLKLLGLAKISTCQGRVPLLMAALDDIVTLFRALVLRYRYRFNLRDSHVTRLLVNLVNTL